MLGYVPRDRPQPCARRKPRLPPRRHHLRRILILGLAALALGTFTWRSGAPHAQAIDPGPAQIPALLLPAVAGCPVGVEVTVDPGPVQLPGIGLFIPPSAAGGGCAQGIAVMLDPGPVSTPGMAFGLPLNAADCAAGTAALNSILRALGGTPLPGTGGSAPPAGDACPDGTASMGGIQTAIIAVLSDPGPINCPRGTIRASDPGPIQRGRGTFVFADPGPAQCPPGTALLIQQDAAGTARGFLALFHPPSPNSPASLQLFQIVPAGVPGESLVHPPSPN